MKIRGDYNRLRINNRYRPPKTYIPHYEESEETKKVRQLSHEIQSIKHENEYIARTGKNPPSTPNYYKRILNIL